jgi:hypothetical protein
MGAEAAILLVLVLSPAIMLLVHMLMVRTLHDKSQQIIAVKAVLAAFVPVGFILYMVSLRFMGSASDLIISVTYAGAVYGLLGMTYFHFFNMSETARRIRILYEIHQAGTLSAETMTSLYKTTGIVTSRLQRLVAMGQLKYDAGYYSIDGRTLYIAGLVVVFFRKLLGLDEDAD